MFNFFPTNREFLAYKLMASLLETEWFFSIVLKAQRAKAQITNHKNQITNKSQISDLNDPNNIFTKR